MIFYPPARVRVLKEENGYTVQYSEKGSNWAYVVDYNSYRWNPITLETFEEAEKLANSKYDQLLSYILKIESYEREQFLAAVLRKYNQKKKRVIWKKP